MNTTELVHYVSTSKWARPTAAPSSIPCSYRELATPLRIAILRARQYLLSERRRDGLWIGHAVGDASLASQMVFLLAYLGEADSELAEQLAGTILDQQFKSGGWATFPDGPADVSASVQAYFAVKLTGYNPSDQRLSAARQAIRKLGGADATDATARFFLALFGQISYDCCPVLAPEMLRFQASKPIRLAALSVLWAHRPVRKIDADRGIRELFVKKPGEWPLPATPQLAAAPIRSRLLVSLLRRCELWGWTPLRCWALDRVEQLLLRFAVPNRDGRIKPRDAAELILAMIALDTLGHGSGSRSFGECERRLNELVVVEEPAERAWVKVRTDPFADTALTARALCASGLPLAQVFVARAAAALAREDRLDTPCSVVDAAALVEVFSAAAGKSHDAADSLPPAIRVGRGNLADNRPESSSISQRQARDRAKDYRSQFLKAQNRDGGWGPTDGLESSSSPDITGGALQTLATCVQRSDQHVLDRAIAYLRAAQRPDGSWTSATGVRLVHGTSLAICGLIAAGISATDEAVEAGLNWLVVHQASGGWGESPTSSPGSPDADFVPARASATQTSWALLALVAAGRTLTKAALHAVQFLLETQEDDGRWHERQFVLRDATTGRHYRSNLHSVTSPLCAVSLGGGCIGG